MDIAYPASAKDIEDFIGRFENRYIDALNRIKHIIVEAKTERSNLSCIYNIYSRGDKQVGKELKHPRKVRLKHNKYCMDNGLHKSNIYDMPDIVGITISVIYPSDINIVCSFLDDLCEKYKVFPRIYDKEKNMVDNNNRLIQTLYGEAEEDKGYFACHYRVRLRNGSEEPIVEIQIKTVLHDAWELKTHDLTYKNSFPVDPVSKKHFELLGSVLLQIDKQSEYLRTSIRRTNVIRDSRRRFVQIETIMLAAAHVAGKASLPNAMAFVGKLRAAIGSNYAITIGLGDIDALREEAISFYNEGAHACSCLFLSAIAAISEDNQSELAALERIDMWCSEKEPEKKIIAHQYAHLARFCFGEVGDAIDVAESIYSEVDALCDKATNRENQMLNLRKKNSVVSSLSYYFADLIGTDEGIKRHAEEKSKQFSKMSLECLAEMALVPHGTKSWTEVIDLPFPKDAADYLFNSIDNAIFVSIQTAKTAAELHNTIRMLDKVKQKRPASLGPLPELLHDLHEHCARTRLLDCEVDEMSAR